MEIEEIFKIDNLVEAQKRCAELLSDAKDAYFAEWQYIHPTLYQSWQRNAEEFKSYGVETLKDMAGTFVPTQYNDMDVFWGAVVARINNERKYPDLKSIPLIMWLRPIPSLDVTPMRYLIEHLIEVVDRNIILADLVRTFNIDAKTINYCPNQWTVELILRCRSSKKINLSRKDRKGWLNNMLRLYSSKELRNNEQVTPTWLAYYMVQFVDTTLDNQGYFEMALKIITKEKYSLDDGAVEFIIRLIKEEWFEEKYTKPLFQALEIYYSKAHDKPMSVRVSSSDSGLADSSYECPAWSHTKERVIWVRSRCVCAIPDQCLMKSHTIFTLTHCNCEPEAFCILKAVAAEYQRLESLKDGSIVFI